jgi:hypothetical protein
MNCPELTAQAFISQFPEFAETDTMLIETMINRACMFVELCGWECGKKKQLVIFLYAAHFLTLQSWITNGDAAGGMETSASIDRVSVTKTLATNNSDSTFVTLPYTRYGEMLLEFFNVHFATPFYVGGSYTRVL